MEFLIYQNPWIGILMFMVGFCNHALKRQGHSLIGGLNDKVTHVGHFMPKTFIKPNSHSLK